MAEKRMSGHPHHKGAGMPGFTRDHWSDKMGNLDCGESKYSKGDPAKELAASVKKLNNYVGSHKAEH